jgi:DMSO/TMAO reductase YedYZ molybdopterin-dependent catalytic subunit
MSQRKIHVPALLIAVILVVVVTFVFIAIFLSRPTRLYPGEVREYMGENLSSLISLDDNAITGTQNLNRSNYRLIVNGLVDSPKNYSVNQVVGGFQNYEKVITLYCVEGWSVRILWQGVLVRDLLSQSGVVPEAKVVIFHAADGYTTSLPISYFYDNDILLASKMNGLTIPIEKGYPFMLVAESKWGYKWIKWITQIEVSDNENYLGYWESRGYSNNADIP